MDVNSLLEYGPGVQYSLFVLVDETLIAEGRAEMPSIPTITYPLSSTVHPLNQPLLVQYEAISYATAAFLIEGYYGSEYSLSLLEAGEITIDGSNFPNNGLYHLEIDALSGVAINWGAIFDLVADGADMGYNIKGPEGVFFIITGESLPFEVN